DQIAGSGEIIFLKIAEDEMQLSLGGGAFEVIHVNESLALICGFRRERDMGKCIDHLGGEMQGVHHDILRLTRVNRNTLDVDYGAIGRERLENNLSGISAIQRVGEICGEIFRKIGMNTTSDLFIWREPDADLS